MTLGAKMLIAVLCALLALSLLSYHRLWEAYVEQINYWPESQCMYTLMDYTYAQNRGGDAIDNLNFILDNPLIFGRRTYQIKDNSRAKVRGDGLSYEVSYTVNPHGICFVRGEMDFLAIASPMAGDEELITLVPDKTKNWKETGDYLVKVGDKVIEKRQLYPSATPKNGWFD